MFFWFIKFILLLLNRLLFFLYLYLCLKNKCHTTVDENYTKYSDLTTQNSISYWKRTALTMARSAQEDEPTTANSQQPTANKQQHGGHERPAERDANELTTDEHRDCTTNSKANSKRTQRNSRQRTSSGKQNTRCLSVRVISAWVCVGVVVVVGDGGCVLPACVRSFGSVRRSARNALAIGEQSIEHVCVLVYGSMSNQNKHKNPNKPKRRTHEDTYALRIK